MRLRNIKYKDVARVLILFGFELQPKKATGHEKWIKKLDGKTLVCMVDKHIQPFSAHIMALIIEESKISKKTWRKCLSNKKYKPKDKELVPER